MTVALDLFAGHGWGVACQWLGVQEYGVEIMPEAIATREANGMETIFYDVWAGLEQRNLFYEASIREHDRHVDYDLLIASPPCQTFSMAGSGSGRKALDEVVTLIDERAYLRVDDLRAFGEKHDPRTALVLTPLAYVARDLPQYVILEQVPPVLPVWERMAEEMRKWGYSAWTGILNAEQYGVPQTRRRAVLIAKRDPDIDGEALPPTPTHSRYYSRTPDKLDVGVEKWVSMAEALGWGDVSVVSNYGTGGDPANRGTRSSASPSASVTSKIDRNIIVRTSMGKPKIDDRNGSHELDPFTRPMHTITSKSDSTTIVAVKHMGAGMVERHGERPGRAIDEPAVTVRASAGGTEPGGFRWQHDRPATTIAGDSRVWPPGHKVNADDIARLGEDEAREKYGDRAGTDSTRITIEEAATLQSYPEDFIWDELVTDAKTGKLKPITKTSKFLQVGNAVPPLLARAILAEVLGLVTQEGPRPFQYRGPSRANVPSPSLARIARNIC